MVGVLDFGEHEGRLFLVMELVEGDSLARVLTQSGPLPAERVAHIAAQAADGLAAAHRQGVVHRDIKPANLLLDADGILKIGDFGIARFLDDPGAALTATGHIVGTSLYLASCVSGRQNMRHRKQGPPSGRVVLTCEDSTTRHERTPSIMDSTPLVKRRSSVRIRQGALSGNRDEAPGREWPGASAIYG